MREAGRGAALAAAALILAGAAAAETTTDPADCAAVWREVGVPVSHNDESGGPDGGAGPEAGSASEADSPGDYTYLCHIGWFARLNHARRTPDFVIERITRAMAEGEETRPSQSFRVEGEVPSDARARNKDYTNSGYARGHQAPSDDFANDEAWMRDTFYYSNATPQEGPAFNSSVWLDLEKLVRSLAIDDGEVVAITGPVYQDFFGTSATRRARLTVSARENTCGGTEIALPRLAKARICDANDDETAAPGACGDEGVAVPAALYKIIYFPRSGRVNAYLMPNEMHPVSGREGLSTEGYLASFRVPVRAIELRTGYDFFPDQDRHSRNVHEESCAATRRR